MVGPDWLLLLGRDGVIEAVDGGAPGSWVSRPVEACRGVPDEVQDAARRLEQERATASAAGLVRRVRVEPREPGAPSFTLLAVAAIFVHPTEVALEPRLRRALEPLSRQAEGLDVSLRIKAAPDVPAQISVDAAKVAWAVTTLVGNALRYVRRGGFTRPGGHVAIALAHDAAQGMVSVTVADDGPGIPAGVRERLLASSADGDETAGVSLSLVRDVVAAHGGRITIESSTEPGESGTTVTLWFPVRSGAG